MPKITELKKKRNQLIIKDYKELFDPTKFRKDWIYQTLADKYFICKAQLREIVKGVKMKSK
jgi:hypothetical protein